jgi:hypothetical protein
MKLLKQWARHDLANLRNRWACVSLGRAHACTHRRSWDTQCGIGRVRLLRAPLAHGDRGTTMGNRSRSSETSSWKNRALCLARTPGRVARPAFRGLCLLAIRPRRGTYMCAAPSVPSSPREAPSSRRGQGSSMSKSGGWLRPMPVLAGLGWQRLLSVHTEHTLPLTEWGGWCPQPAQALAGYSACTEGTSRPDLPRVGRLPAGLGPGASVPGASDRPGKG